MFWFSSFRSRFIISEKRPFSARNWINLIPDIYPRDKKRIDLERKILYENGFDGHTDGCLLQYASVQKPKSTKVHSKSFGPMPAAGRPVRYPGGFCFGVRRNSRGGAGWRVRSVRPKGEQFVGCGGSVRRPSCRMNRTTDVGDLWRRAGRRRRLCPFPSGTVFRLLPPHTGQSLRTDEKKAHELL